MQHEITIFLLLPFTAARIFMPEKPRFIRKTAMSAPMPPKRPNLVLTATVVLSLVLSIAIGFVVAEPPYFDFEKPLMLWINRHTGDWYAPLAAVFHYVGKTALAVPVLALLAALAYWRKKPRHAALLVLAPLLSTLSMLLIKISVNRPRPEFWPRLIEESNWSFPSGHSSFGAVIAAIVILSSRRFPQRHVITAAALVFAFLMGFSRLYLGVHYPTDVFAGWTNGALFTLLVYWLVFKVYPKK